MRIAYITADFGIPVFGNKGASIHVREMCSALEQQGHDVRVFTPRLGGERPKTFNAPVHEIVLDKATRSTISLLKSDPAAGDVMTKEIRSIVYAAELKRRVMDTFGSWMPDAIYERYSLLATAGSDLARELNIPHILEVNAPLSEEAAQHRGLAFAQTVDNVERQILRAADHIIAVSVPMKVWIEERGVSSDQIEVLPNGVNADLFTNIEKSESTRPRNSSRPVVGFVGTLKEWHGTSTLIRAMSILAKSRDERHVPRLLIVGDGPQRESLLHQAFEEGIGHLVTFTGTVTHAEIPSCIAQMDVAVAPYDQLPNFYFSPLKIFEYLAAGRPIVASDIGQVSEILRSGELGLLYEPGNAVQLADRISQLIDQPPLARSIGDRARAAAIEDHSWNHHADVVSDLMRRHRNVGSDRFASLATGGNIQK